MWFSVDSYATEGIKKTERGRSLYHGLWQRAFPHPMKGGNKKVVVVVDDFPLGPFSAPYDETERRNTTTVISRLRVWFTGGRGGNAI